MKLINKKNNFTVRFLNFFYNSFHSFFKLSTELCACNKCAHIQCDYLF